MEIVRSLPKGVSLSDHLKERAAFFIVIQQFGISYYVAATPEVRRMLKLGANGKAASLKERRAWREQMDNEKGLRDVIASIHLQLRDVVFAGIEDGVTAELLKHFKRAMQPKVRGMVEVAAAPASALMLEGGSQ